MRLRSLGALPRLCLPVGQLTRACQLTARASVPPGAPAGWLTRFRSWLVRARRPAPGALPRSYLPAGLCLLVRRPASGSIAPLHPLSARAFAPAGPSSGSRPHSHPLVSKNAKSLRYNSDAVVLPKRARRLPGMMQTANMAKQDSTAPVQVIAHTFGLFRESSGCARLQQCGNGRFRGPGGIPCRCIGAKTAVFRCHATFAWR